MKYQEWREGFRMKYQEWREREGTWKEKGESLAGEERVEGREVFAVRGETGQERRFVLFTCKDRSI